MQHVLWYWSSFLSKLFRFLLSRKGPWLSGGDWLHGLDCFGTGEIILWTCLILPIDFLGTLHVSLDQLPSFWMAQKEGEDSFSTMAISVSLAHLTCTVRRCCDFCLQATKACGIPFFFSGSCWGLYLLLCSDICKLSAKRPLFFIDASLRLELELQLFLFFL